MLVLDNFTIHIQDRYSNTHIGGNNQSINLYFKTIVFKATKLGGLFNKKSNVLKDKIKILFTQSPSLRKKLELFHLVVVVYLFLISRAFLLLIPK